MEVRDYLHVLAEQIRHLKQENLLLKKDLQDRENLIKDYRDREHILKESIANAESWAQRIKQEAEAHRQLMLEKAESDSESLIESARKSLQTVYNDIADLKRLQVQFKTGLKAALQVQMELLEDDSVFNPALLTDPEGQAKLPYPTENSVETSSRETKQLRKPIHPKKESSLTYPNEAKNNEAKNSEEINSLRESLNSLNKNFS